MPMSSLKDLMVLNRPVSSLSFFACSSSGHPCRRGGSSFHGGCCTHSHSCSGGSLEQQEQGKRPEVTESIPATFDFDRSGFHHALIVV